jgi:hypothetical protein
MTFLFLKYGPPRDPDLLRQLTHLKGHPPAGSHAPGKLPNHRGRSLPTQPHFPCRKGKSARFFWTEAADAQTPYFGGERA